MEDLSYELEVATLALYADEMVVEEFATLREALGYAPATFLVDQEAA